MRSAKGFASCSFEVVPGRLDLSAPVATRFPSVAAIDLKIFCSFSL